jgi:hypothetical protein
MVLLMVDGGTYYGFSFQVVQLFFKCFSSYYFLSNCDETADFFVPDGFSLMVMVLMIVLGFRK